MSVGSAVTHKIGQHACLRCPPPEICSVRIPIHSLGMQLSTGWSSNKVSEHARPTDPHMWTQALLTRQMPRCNSQVNSVCSTLLGLRSLGSTPNANRLQRLLLDSLLCSDIKVKYNAVWWKSPPSSLPKVRAEQTPLSKVMDVVHINAEGLSDLGKDAGEQHVTVQCLPSCLIFPINFNGKVIHCHYLKPLCLSS